MGVRAKLAGLLAVILFLAVHTAVAAEYNSLGAVYWDTLNRANVKVGVASGEPFVYDEERPFSFGSFNYADVEAGMEGYKLAVGSGVNTRHGLDRIGLSYASMHTQDLIGVEAVISNMGMSVKMGYYLGLENTPNRWLLGLGMGF